MEFFEKIANGFEPLAIFVKKTPSKIFDRVLFKPLLWF